MLNVHNITKLIKEERERQGLSRKQLAEIIGVTERAIQYWESSKRGLTLNNADALLKALNLCLTIGVD